jgi:hypothetical protein
MGEVGNVRLLKRCSEVSDVLWRIAMAILIRANDEFRVNTTTASDQYEPLVAALADGGYVVTWMSHYQDGSGLGVSAQRYGANGSAQGGEFRVNTTTAYDQCEPLVAALADGGSRSTKTKGRLWQRTDRRRRLSDGSDTLLTTGSCRSERHSSDLRTRSFGGSRKAPASQVEHVMPRADELGVSDSTGAIGRSSGLEG